MLKKLLFITLVLQSLALAGEPIAITFDKHVDPDDEMIQVGSQKLSAQVASIAMEGESPDHLICVSDEWKKLNAELAAQIESLEKEMPEAIKKVDQNSCISLKNVSKEKMSAAAAVITKIGEVTGERMTVFADDDFAEKFRKHGIWQKLGRAQLQTLAGHVIFMGALLATPPSFTKWDFGLGPELIHHGGEYLKRAWTTPPVHDKDNFVTNMVAHPMCGAMTYNLVRSQGASWWVSFLFSTSQSLLWEFGTEALFEQPSQQDILFTSTIGSLMGEGAHQLTLQMRKGGFKTWEKVVVTIINPTYVINHGYH